MREVLDAIEAAQLDGMFSDFLHRLQRGKHLANYQFFGGMYLVSIDGSEYFSSQNIHCPHCFVTQSKGVNRYHHQTLQSVIVHPDMRQVIPLSPEQISNRDGTKKQDCGINASKRVVHNIKKTYPKIKVTISADDLYSKQPFINELRKTKDVFYSGGQTY